MKFFNDIKKAYEDAGIKQYKNSGCFDRFHFLGDFKNDLKALVIKPLTCILFGTITVISCVYQLGLAAIHFVTLSPKKAMEHLGHALSFLAQSIGYYFLMAPAELLLQGISLILRTLSTLIYGVGQVIAGIGHGISAIGSAFSGFFSSGAQQRDYLPSDDDNLPQDQDFSEYNYLRQTSDPEWEARMFLAYPTPR